MKALLWLAPVVFLGACVPKEDLQPPPAWMSKEGRNEVRLHIAEALLEKGQTDEARKVLLLAVEENADPAEIALFQGWAMQLDGLPSEAEPLLREAARLRPKDPRAWKMLGVIEADSGRVDEAIASFRRAVEYEPTSAASWNNLGFLLLSAGEYAEASAALSKAVSLDGSVARYRHNLGFALAASGKMTEALATFRSASSEADAQSNLALAYELAGDIEKARIHYQKAVAADPNHVNATEALKRLDGVAATDAPKPVPEETP